VVLPDPVVLQLLLALLVLLLQPLPKQPAASAAAVDASLPATGAGGSKLSYTSLFIRPAGSSTRCDCRSAGQQSKCSSPIADINVKGKQYNRVTAPTVLL
jgi:hypothetical protein